MPRQKQVLTPEQLEARKQRQRESTKRWAIANSEKLKAAKKANYQKNIESIKARKAKYRAANKDKITAYNKEYYARNPEFHSQRFSVWYEANKEKCNARWRNYYSINTEKIKQRKNIYRLENKEKIKAYEKEYRTNNLLVFRLQAAKRKARKLENGGELSKGLIPNLMRLQKGLCACCREKLVNYQIDHIYPLAKGGQNIDSNIQLLCPDCNRRKNAKHPIDFMQSKGYLL
jgi:5-methylcytosine-specific restriction endonuclease McrA